MAHLLPRVLLVSLSRPAYPTLRGLGLRYYSSTSSTSPSLKLVAELRKQTTVTIQKAREALTASGGDVQGALSWLENDRVASGQRKAEKVGSRFAGQGLIGVSVLSQGTGGTGNGENMGVRAAMIEVNCETDFVSRNELFRKLAQDLAFTTAYITEPTTKLDCLIRPVELEHLRDAPLIGQDYDGTSPTKTVSEAIRDTISAVGENINLRRAVAFVLPSFPPVYGVGLRATSYVHGALTPNPPTVDRTRPFAVVEAQGRIGALAAISFETSPSRLRELFQSADFMTEVNTLERALARQIVGFGPEIGGEADDTLYNQPFDTLTSSGGRSVGEVLDRWAEQHGIVTDLPQEHEKEQERQEEEEEQQEKEQEKEQEKLEEEEDDDDDDDPGPELAADKARAPDCVRVIGHVRWEVGEGLQQTN